MRMRLSGSAQIMRRSRSRHGCDTQSGMLKSAAIMRGNICCRAMTGLSRSSDRRRKGYWPAHSHGTCIEAVHASTIPNESDSC